jgi:NAD-dependent SIR2 family protein deacetylase
MVAPPSSNLRADPALAETLRRAAETIASAEALFVGAGAGMGVDSGLPDFRGTEGFWTAYPAAARLGLSFSDLANPRWFRDDPERAWGFYGHRLNLYRSIRPHRGFEVLKTWGGRMDRGGFAYTSNVDGQFQRAGLGRVVECHGSIHHLQCTVPCSDRIWSADGAALAVDEEALRCTGPLPRCPDCGAVARPNILMFGDGGWDPSRTEQQYLAMEDWTGTLFGRRLVVIELGAGTAIPTVRYRCESLAQQFGGQLVRINPRAADGPPGALSLPLGGLEALETLELLCADLVGST